MANHHGAVLPLALDFGPDPGPAGAMYTELLLPEVSQGPGRDLRRTGRPEGPRRGAPRRDGADGPAEHRQMAVDLDARPVLQGPEGQPRRGGQVLRGRRVRHFRYAAAGETLASPTAGGPPVSHYHVWKFQEPEPGEFAFHRENEIHLSRATASRKRAAPDDIVRVCYAATPPTDARPNWAALCRELNEKG